MQSDFTRPEVGFGSEVGTGLGSSLAPKTRAITGIHITLAAIMTISITIKTIIIMNIIIVVIIRIIITS